MTESLVKPASNDSDPVRGLQRYLEPRAKTLAKYAANRIKPDMLIRLALFEFSQNDWLRKCTPESIYGSLVLAAQIGLEPSGIKGHAYLVPFRGKCTLIPGWRGLVHLALRSRGVTRINSYPVFEGDDFKIFLGSDPRVEHTPCIGGDKGEFLGTYATAKLANGEIDVEWMDCGELQKIKDGAARSRGGKPGPAYDEHEIEMYRKAPIRRLAKRLPLGDDFYQALRADELAQTGDQDKMIIDVEGSEAPSQNLTDAIGNKLAERAAAVRDQQD